MEWGLIVFQALTTLTFRPPRPFEAGTHGPAATGTSYSYPPPSTLAGALAFIAYTGGYCKPSRVSLESEYDDVRECLKPLLGGEPLVRAGLVLVGEPGGRERYYAYLGTRRLVPLEGLLEVLSGIPSSHGGRAAGELDRKLASLQTLKTPSRHKYGVGLDRTRKASIEGMLYSINRITYPPHLAWLPVLLVRPKPKPLNKVMRLGGKEGLALVKAMNDESNPGRLLLKRGEGEGMWLAILLTPALLEAGELGDCQGHEAGSPILANSREWSECIASKLVRGKCGTRAKLLYVPRNEWRLAVTTPGWSLALNAPRRPMLVIPPGSLLVVEDADEACARRLAEEGVGDHSDLGWGTVVLAPGKS